MLKISYIKHSLLFVLLVILQVVIFSNVSFLNYAIPIIYLYFILKLPIDINRNILLLLGFGIGFIIDIFCNTPGINAAATTLIAFIRKPVMSAFISNEIEELEPSAKTFGLTNFMKYAAVLILIHISLLVVLESFSVYSIKLMLLRIIFSSILSILLILGFEGFSYTRKGS